MAVSPSDSADEIRRLEECLIELHAWFLSNELALNPDKTDAIIFGTHRRLQALDTISHIDVAGVQVQLSGEVKLLGVVLDKSLTLDSLVKAMSNAIYYHIHAFRHIRHALKADTAKSVTCALLGSRLDYANSVHFGTSAKNVPKQQRLQNSVARVVIRSGRRSQALPILKQLAWLPVKYRIDFKIAVLTYKLRTTSEPMYLSNLISIYEPRRFLRSADAQLLQTPCVKTVNGSRAFRSASPKIENALRHDLRSSQSLLTFRQKLKTFYFKLPFNRTVNSPRLRFVV